MKTAVSIPTPLFEAAERRAQRMGISRSQLYANALRRLLADDFDAEVTANLNEVYGHEDSSLDPVLKAARARVLAEEW